MSLEHMLTQTLDKNVAVTPAQLSDMMEMFLTVLYLRRVSLAYWMEVGPIAFRGITLAQRIQAEANLTGIEGLSAQAVNTVEGSINLSIQEIKALRAELLVKLEAMKKMALPGTTIH